MLLSDQVLITLISTLGTIISGTVSAAVVILQSRKTRRHVTEDMGHVKRELMTLRRGQVALGAGEPVPDIAVERPAELEPRAPRKGKPTNKVNQ